MDTQMDPNGHQNTQMDQMDPNGHLNGPKWTPKWTQMDTKIPKRPFGSIWVHLGK